MNLLSKKAFNLFKSFYYISQRSFVRLHPEKLQKLKNQESPRKYYETLLEEAPVNDKEILKVEPEHLTRIIERCKEAEDINILVEAYYNLLGHRTFFTNTQIDNLILKAIECQNPQACLDILRHHNLLMYYPHPDVLDRLIAYYKDTNNSEEAKKLFDVVSKQKLMKTNPTFYETCIFASNHSGDHTLAFSAFSVAYSKNIPLSTDALSALIDSVYQHQTAAAEKKSLGIESQLIEAAQKAKLPRGDFLKLSLSNAPHAMEYAIKTIEVLAETQEVTLAEGEFYFGNDENTINYFNTIYPLLEDKIRFYARLTRAIKAIKRKYLKQAVAKEVQDIMYQANTKMSKIIREKGGSEAEVAEATGGAENKEAAN